MADKEGNKTGGRQKGTANKRTFDAQLLADRLNVDPLEVLLHAANNNWSALGYDSAIQTKLVGDNAITEDTIPISQRIQAAKEATKYLYPARKAIEFKDEDGNDVLAQILLNARTRVGKAEDKDA